MMQQMEGGRKMGSADQERLMRHLAHELRQPLSGIESIAYYLEMVLGGAEPEIQQQCDRLRRMVQQAHWLLEDSSLAMRAAGASLGGAPLGEYLTRLGAECALHEERTLEMSVGVNVRAAWVPAAAAYQFCDHLIAFFLGPAQAPDPILVTLKEEGGRVVLEVSAEPGADVEDLQHALEPPAPGGGVRRFLESCGGRMEVSGEGGSLRVRCEFLVAEG